MSRVRVKICGLTRREDVSTAAAAGADYLGFVFAGSPRCVSPAKAAGLVAEVPEGVVSVGLFMDEDAEVVREVLDSVPLDMLQFHGSEENEWCRQFGKPFIKAISMGGNVSISEMRDRFSDATGLLYDSHAPGAAGGTGKTFDWSLLNDAGPDFWLAGGLNPGNVIKAIQRCRPRVVDTSSGVEDRPGIKNHKLLREFVDRAKSVEL